jgi:hypothetical protein
MKIIYLLNVLFSFNKISIVKLYALHPLIFIMMKIIEFTFTAPFPYVSLPIYAGFLRLFHLDSRIFF